MRPVLLTSEPGEVSRASGTAVAVSGLVAALACHGVALTVVRARRHPLGHTAARARFNNATVLPRGMYDVVLGVGGDGAAAAGVIGVPFVALPKAMYSEVLVHERGLTRALLHRHAAWEAAAARAAALVVVPSGAAAAVVRDRWHVPRARVVVIPEPFDHAAWRATATQGRREGGRVLAVAHLFPRKRIGDLLAAWPAVLAQRPDARLDVAGGGPQLRRLRRAAAGLAGVRVLGHVEPARLRDLYACADVAVSTSAHETFGYAALEALAAGLPLVYADAPALVDLCSDAVGRRVPVGDDSALATAILGALDPAVASEAAAVNPAIAARCDQSVVGAAYLAALAAVDR